MIVQQLLKVLPAASSFKIIDEYKPVMEGSISMYDKTIMFKSVDEYLKFQQVYGNFHIELVDKIDDIWIINVR